MSLDGDAHEMCDDCGRIAFEPKPCGSCGPSMRFCREHHTKCLTCDETYCNDHYPAHRESCAKINAPIIEVVQ